MNTVQYKISLIYSVILFFFSSISFIPIKSIMNFEINLVNHFIYIKCAYLINIVILTAWKLHNKLCQACTKNNILFNKYYFKGYIFTYRIRLDMIPANMIRTWRMKVYCYHIGWCNTILEKCLSIQKHKIYNNFFSFILNMSPFIVNMSACTNLRTTPIVFTIIRANHDRVKYLTHQPFPLT